MKQKAYLIRKSKEDKYKFTIFDWTEFENKVIQNFGLVTKTLVDLLLTVSRFDSKTNEQLGYLHTEVLEKLVIAYNILGWICPNHNKAKTLLKDQTGYYDEIVNELTGEIIKEYKSYRKAKVNELMDAINYAIINVCGTAGVEVKPPRKPLK